MTDARAVPAQLRVGLLGTGWAAERHARALQAHPAAELAAVANWREESLARMAERFGVSRTTTDWRELAAAPDIDAVVIATPNALHAPQAVAVLEAGKSVMVEKPMAASLDQARGMVEAADRAPGWLMVRTAGGFILTCGGCASGSRPDGWARW